MKLENLPLKPTMLWDGECGFCYHWILRWQKATGDTVEYYPYQEVLSEFPQVSEADCKAAVLCENIGLCALDKEKSRCVPGSPEDCAITPDCKAGGLCAYDEATKKCIKGDAPEE